ncbi:hypothetical protein Trydic_g4853 [Trypoxylus dichotomus]
MRILQANIGRGKASTEEACRYAVENSYDVVCVQEPHRDWSAWRKCGQEIGEEQGKVITVVKEGFRTQKLAEYTTRNMAFVSIEDGNKEKKRSGVSRRLQRQKRRMGGRSHQRERREANGMAGEKQPHAPQRGRGSPNIRNGQRKELDRPHHHNDGVEVIEWEVLSQDLLSDHRGIHVRLGNDRERSETERRREATRYSKRGADWEKFERSVRKSVEEGPQIEESEGQWWQEVCCKAEEGAETIPPHHHESL